MTRHEEIQQIIDRAKDQRAEFIGAALRPAVLPIALVAALSLVVAQFGDADVEETAERAPTVMLVEA